MLNTSALPIMPKIIGLQSLENLLPIASNGMLGSLQPYLNETFKFIKVAKSPTRFETLAMLELLMLKD